jgi:hypothetical protein
MTQRELIREARKIIPITTVTFDVDCRKKVPAVRAIYIHTGPNQCVLGHNAEEALQALKDRCDAPK